MPGEITRLPPPGMSFQTWALDLVRTRGPIKTAALAGLMDWENIKTSALLSGMKGKGLVARTPEGWVVADSASQALAIRAQQPLDKREAIDAATEPVIDEEAQAQEAFNAYMWICTDAIALALWKRYQAAQPARKED